MRRELKKRHRQQSDAIKRLLGNLPLDDDAADFSLHAPSRDMHSIIACSLRAVFRDMRPISALKVRALIVGPLRTISPQISPPQKLIVTETAN
jgi:hypothetical protein